MPTRRLVLLFGLLAAGACDQVAEPVRVAQEVPKPAARATASAHATLDLHAMVDAIARGEIKTATELEAKLDTEGLAHIDIDGDGQRDRLRIIEKRDEVKTTFEIRALPSSKTEVKVADAPTVARFELHADAVGGTVEASAGFTASFSATAKLDADARVTHTFTGIVGDVDGRLSVGADANAFVAWAFSVGRPVYVADVFVVEVETHRHDPCWPPGHCKHGHWNASDDPPPGRPKKAHGGAHAGAIGFHGGSKAGKHGKHGKHGKGK